MFVSILGCDRLKRIVFLGRGLVTYTFSTSVAQGIMMLYALVLARHLGPEKYGYYAAGYSLIGLWTFIVGFGMDAWFLQKGSIDPHPEHLAGKILKVKFLIFLVWAPSIILGISLLQKPVITPAFLIICALDIWWDNNFSTIIYGLNIQRRYSTIAVLLLSSRLGRLIGALVLVWQNVNSPLFFAICRLLFTGLGLSIALYVFRPFQKRYFDDQAPIPLKELLPFVLSEMFVQIYVVADVSLLSLLTTPLQVGLYSPASTLLSALFIIPSTIHLSLIPIFSRKISRQNHFFDITIFSPIIGLGALGLFLSFGLGLGGKWIMPYLLGYEFEGTSTLVFLLSPILFFKSLQFGLAAIIVAAGWQKYRLIPQAIAAITNLGLNLFLIPIYGAKGAAFAYNLSELLLLIGYAVLVISIKHKISVVSND